MHHEEKEPSFRFGHLQNTATYYVRSMEFGEEGVAQDISHGQKHGHRQITRPGWKMSRGGGSRLPFAI